MVASRTKGWIALGCAGAALVAVLAGFYASWDTLKATAPGTGTLAVHYRLAEERAEAGGASESVAYASPQSDASAGLKETFRNQTIVVWGTLLLALAATSLLALDAFQPSRAVFLAALGALALLTIGAGAGSALFAYNFTHTKEGSQPNDPVTGGDFWGSRGGFSWGPGFAWYAEVAAAVLALAGLVVALTMRAEPAPAASSA
jgi:hypothetical protein